MSSSPSYEGYAVPEVLRRLGNCLAVKANDYTTKLLIAVSDIEVNLFKQSAAHSEPIAHSNTPYE